MTLPNPLWHRMLLLFVSGRPQACDVTGGLASSDAILSFARSSARLVGRPSKTVVRTRVSERTQVIMTRMNCGESL